MKHLQSLSYKTLFTILFFSLAGIVFFLKIGGKTTKVSAAWWDDSWHYRKAISITNSSGSNLTDFQVAVSIGTSQLIADGKMQTDCDDIRITDINGNLLPYWIEPTGPNSCNQAADTRIWVKANSLPTSGTTVYFYYGNSSANSTSNLNSIITPTTVVSNVLTSGGINQNLTWTNVQLRGKILVFGSLERSGGCGGTTRYDEITISGVGTTWYASDSGLCEPADGYISGGARQLIQDLIDFNAGEYSINWKTDGSAVSGGKDKTLANKGNYNNQGGIEIIRLFKYASVDPTPTLQSEELSPAPIAYWKFDEGTGTTAYDSAGNNNGTFLSAPVWKNESECVYGKCLAFDNVDDGVSINNKNFTDLNNYTMCSWVKPIGNHKNYTGTIISSGDWNTNHWAFGISQTNNSIQIRRADGVNHPSWSYNFPLNIWSYICITRQNTTITAYVNGKQVGSPYTGITGNLVSNASNTTIGRETYAGGYFAFNGLIDEPKIYPYARTADQIKQDYNSRGSMSGSSVNLGVQSNTTPSLKSSLVAHYKFDEGNGTVAYDSSGNNNNGSFGTGNSGPTWANDGKINKALNFNGSQSIVTPYNSAFIITQDGFTYTAWIKPANFSKSYNMFMGEYLPYFNVNSAAKLHLSMTANGSQRSVYSNTTLQTNQWYHVAATYDINGYMKVYLNGKLDGIAGPFLTPGNSGANFYIGKWYSGDSEQFTGLIDEAKRYNRALTPEEIKQDYNQGSAIQFGTTNQTIGGTTTSLEYCIPGDTSFCASPVAEWKMDEGVGTSIIDTSGIDNTGTISGATFTQGKIGKSLSLNGTSDYVSIPIYNYTTNATISVWVKGSYANGNQIIVGSPNSIALGLYNSGSDKALIGSSVPGKAVGISNNFINDSWNYLTVVFDNSGNATYYCNGQLLSNSGTNYWIWSSGTYIGRRDSGNYFKGQIDQLKIYNYARTPAQIAYDYNKGGPVGWWKFDECQGNIAYDWSGTPAGVGNTGTIIIGPSGTQNSLGTCQVGTSAAWTNGSIGKINSSLNFDGNDDYINAGNSNIFNLTDTFTISSWIKLSSLNRYHGIVGKTASIWSDVTYSTRVSSDNKYSFVTYGTSQDDLSGGTADLNWHHVVFWFSKPTKRIYVDGIKIAENTWNQSLRTNSQNISLGAYAWGGGLSYLLNGQIDDVRIYNYALTSEQVKQIYNGGSVSFN